MYRGTSQGRRFAFTRGGGPMKSFFLHVNAFESVHQTTPYDTVMEKIIRPSISRVFFNFLFILMPGTTKGTFVWTDIMITTKIAHKSLI